MSTTTTSQTPGRPSIAFFGATGGCANACLVHTLRAGHTVSALARTPARLRKQLVDQGISEEVLSRQLLITQGDAMDVDAVKKTLTAGGSSSTNEGDHHLVSTIVSGIGAAPRWQFSFNFLVMDNPIICATAANALLTALQEVYAQTPALKSAKPLATFISTTGITDGPEDVPWIMRFLYHKILHVPHVDKKNMENLYRNNMADADVSKRLFRTVVGIRPTLLTGAVSVDDAAGLDKIRVGTEDAPELGYTIKRADVGHWMFQNLIRNAGQGWEGQMVSMTS